MNKKKIIAYIINSTLYDMENEISKLFKDGWELYGNTFTDKDNCNYVQAMVKMIPDEQ